MALSDITRHSDQNERPTTCGGHGDTMNAELTISSALRPSDISTSSFPCLQPTDNVDNILPRVRRQSSIAGCHVPMSPVEDDRDGQTWKELAQVLDRLFFWLMLMAMTSCCAMIVLAPVYKHQ